MKKRIIKILAFILFIIITISSINKITDVLCIKSGHGINQARHFYDQPEDSIDVVFMGTSHIHCNVNTALLWEDYNIAAYDLTGAEQPLWMTYYFLKEVFKTQSPKLIVLDLFGAVTITEDYHEKWVSENVYGMKFSINKLEMLQQSIAPEKITLYFPTIWANHGRYKELTSEDYAVLTESKTEQASFKGYTPYFGTEVWEKPIAKEVEEEPILQKSEEYLMKIIDYVEKQDAELLLIVAPYIRNEEHDANYKYIERILQERNVEYINYNDLYDEINLDFSSDFNDWSHLNYYGSCKFTDYLAKDILKKNYNFFHEGQERKYESWEMHVDLINKEVEENLN